MSDRSVILVSSEIKQEDRGNKKVFALLFSLLVMSDSLRPHGLQHTRLPCPSLSPGIRSDSCPLNP